MKKNWSSYYTLRSKRCELLKQKKIEIRETEALINISGGDARKLLNLLEIVIDTSSDLIKEKGKQAGPKKDDRDDAVVITNEFVMEVAQKRIALYDKSGEQHYDIISAFIKSIRGSDPNAASLLACTND